MLHNISARVWGNFKLLFYEIVLATLLVNGYPGVGGEFGLAGGENVEAAPPHKLPALAQVSHLWGRDLVSGYSERMTCPKFTENRIR